MQVLSEVEWLKSTQHWLTISPDVKKRVSESPLDAFWLASSRLYPGNEIAEDYENYRHSLVPVWEGGVASYLEGYDDMIIDIITGETEHGMMGDRDTVVFTADKAAHWFILVWGFTSTTNIYIDRSGQYLQKLHSGNSITLAQIRDQLNHKFRYGDIRYCEK